MLFFHALDAAMIGSDPIFNAPDHEPHRPYYSPDVRPGDVIVWREWVGGCHVGRDGVVQTVETTPFEYVTVRGRIIPTRIIERIERVERGDAKQIYVTRSRDSGCNTA